MTFLFWRLLHLLFVSLKSVTQIINWMPSVCRPAIYSDVCIKTYLFLLLLASIVTLLAQGLKLTHVEHGYITIVSIYMIHYFGRNYQALAQAFYAEWTLLKLLHTNALPTS